MPTFIDLDLFADAVHENAKEKGFHEQHKNNDDDFINYQINNLHSEVSELHDAWRNGQFNEPCDKSDKMILAGIPELTCAEEEYADIIIRALDQCRRLGVDITRAIAIKHQYNTTREPMHGGKKS